MADNITKNDDEWHPVINYDRCTACGKCLNFCLFGVYSVDEDQNVVVSAPSNCKDQCPACARVCPEQAIIFPLSSEPAINGSAIAAPSENNAELDQLMGGDVYGALAARRRRSKIKLLRKQELEKAEKERECCSTNSFGMLPTLVVAADSEGCGCSPSNEAIKATDSCECSGDCETCTDCNCEDSGGCDCSSGCC